jgi:hypothetical protein
MGFFHPSEGPLERAKDLFESILFHPRLSSHKRKNPLGEPRGWYWQSRRGCCVNGLQGRNVWGFELKVLNLEERVYEICGRGEFWAFPSVLTDYL